MTGPFLFDSLTELAAATVGEPGKRLFFLIVGSERGWVRSWLEKEQLRALAEGLDELLDRVAGKPTERPAGEANPDIPTSIMLGDFAVARMAVGYDEERDAVTLLVHEAGGDTGPEPTLACRLTRQQAAALAVQAIAVVEAGRPICPLCERPIDPAGHHCPRTNGHKSTGF